MYMKLTKQQYSYLKAECGLDNYIYKRLFGEWYLFRMYQNKKTHPFGYHVIVLRRLRIED